MLNQPTYSIQIEIPKRLSLNTFLDKIKIQPSDNV